MDTSGSQHNSTGGNVILLNNNDLLQQRATLSSGQQVRRFVRNKYVNLNIFFLEDYSENQFITNIDFNNNSITTRTNSSDS